MSLVDKANIPRVCMHAQYIYILCIHNSVVSYYIITSIDPNGRINIQNWRFMSLVCGVVVPRNKVIMNYLLAHLRRCSLDPHTDEGKFAQFAMQVRSHSLPYSGICTVP